MTGRSRLRPAVAASAALAAWAGCVACRAAPREERLVVLAASSLREAFAEVAAGFEAVHPGVRVELAFAGSQELRAQVEHGAPADVFAAADVAHAIALEREGLAFPHEVFARTRPVIAVAPGAPIRSIEDLPRAARIAIGAPEVPIGRYAAAILDRAQERLGTDFRASVEARIASREFSVRQVLAKVELGEADAGIVYLTDLRPGVTAVPIPAAFRVEAAYPIAVLREARRPERARAFVAWVGSQPGRRILRAHGFDAP